MSKNWQLAGNNWMWSASPDGTTHSLLTTMVMSSLLNVSVGHSAVRTMLYDWTSNVAMLMAMLIIIY